MKQSADLYTVDLLDAPRRGRPRKANALTPAERARRYRARVRDGCQQRPELAVFLEENGVRTLDDLADLTMDEARALIMKARARWFVAGPTR